MEEGITPHILWATCRADQTSADASIDGGWNGAFTYYFCKEWIPVKTNFHKVQCWKK